MSSPSRDKYIISADQLATLSLVASNLDHTQMIYSLPPQAKAQIRNSVEALASMVRFIESSPLPTLSETLEKGNSDA